MKKQRHGWCRKAIQQKGKGKNMTKDVIALYCIGIIALILAAANGMYYYKKKKQTAKASATVVSVTQAGIMTLKARSSKYAKVSYQVNGKTYTAVNLLPVPMAVQPGSQVTVNYELEQPDHICQLSIGKSIAALAVGLICVAAATYYYSIK